MDRTKGWSLSSVPLTTAALHRHQWWRILARQGRALTLSLCFFSSLSLSASLFSFFPSLGFEW
uniref:Uncharacterized protein n=1 Tax=Fagus sylvatica TaxID=28930 RepID=A0A2N9HNU5_FAGSY